MVRSMTGFGRAQKIVDSLDITVEIKSVNHKYFEFNAKTPRAFGFLDEKLKNYVKSRVSRGKIELYVSIVSATADDSTTVELDIGLAQSYYAALKRISEVLPVADDITASVLARNNDLFIVRRTPLDEDAITNAVLEVTEFAVDEFISMRENEGEKLVADVCGRLNTIRETVGFIEGRSEKTTAEYRQRLEQKIKDLLGDVQVDEQRLLTETAIFADKIAVDEETVRLRSHIQQFEKMLGSAEAVGRKFDFLVQEMNRETNTIGSKSQDIEISYKVVDIKAEIEKIREQIQNIE